MTNSYIGSLGSSPRFAVVALLTALVLTAESATAGAWSVTKTLQGKFAVSSPPESPVVAVNGNGHAVVVWDSTGSIRYAEHLKGGAWTSSSAVVPGATGGPATVAIGNNEVTAVAWTTVATRYVPSKLVVTVRAPAGTFSAPTAVAAGTGVWYLKLGVACDGTVTLVWNNATGVYASTLPGDPAAGDPVACIGLPGAGPWSVPTLISNAGANANLPDLVVNDAGAALAVWQQGAPGNPTAIAAAYRPAGGGWEAPQVVSTGAGLSTWNPKPGIDAAGDAVVGYLDGNTMRVAVKPATGSWGLPEAISGRQNVYYPALAMNSAGDVVAAWQALDAGNSGSIWERTLTAGGAWGTTIRLSSVSDASVWPTAAFSSDGSVAVVSWVDDTAQKARASVRTLAGTWTRYTLGTGWWGLTVPVGAGGGTITAAWAVPNLANPNAATIVGKSYE